MSALDTTLGALSYDLEVAAKVASVVRIIHCSIDNCVNASSQFTAWATYSDGRLLGIDQLLTRDYVSTMRRFAEMCVKEAKNNDYEDRNR